MRRLALVYIEKFRNVTVGLYIHCGTVSYAHQCVGVTLIDEALWFL